MWLIYLVANGSTGMLVRHVARRKYEYNCSFDKTLLMENCPVALFLHRKWEFTLIALVHVAICLSKQPLLHLPSSRHARQNPLTVYNLAMARCS